MINIRNFWLLVPPLALTATPAMAITPYTPCYCEEHFALVSGTENSGTWQCSITCEMTTTGQEASDSQKLNEPTSVGQLGGLFSEFIYDFQEQHGLISPMQKCTVET